MGTAVLSAHRRGSKLSGFSVYWLNTSAVRTWCWKPGDPWRASGLQSATEARYWVVMSATDGGASNRVDAYMRKRQRQVDPNIYRRSIKWLPTSLLPCLPHNTLTAIGRSMSLT